MTTLDILIRARDQASAVVDRVSKSAGGLENRLATAERVVSSTGRTLTKNLTLPIVAAGVAFGKAGADFESSFAGVRKTVDATEPEFAALSQGFRDMAKEIPLSVHEINAIGEAAGQLGIKTENILGFTRTMADLGVTTNLSSDEAATALARLANITQMPQSKFDRLGSTVVGLGNNLATTEAEIVAMGLRLAGAGKQAGLSEAEILGFAGALSSVGIEADAGGSAVSKVMIAIAKSVKQGGDELDAFAEVAGMSSEKFKRAFEEDAAGAIVTFIEGLGKVASEGGDVFTLLEDLGLQETRVRDALLRASGAGDLFRESLKLGSDAWQENTALTKEAEQRYETFSSQLQVVRNRVYDVAVTVGSALIPVFKDMVDRLAPMIERAAGLAARFGELSPRTRTLIVAAAGLAAALGPVLLILGKMIAVVKVAVMTVGFLASPIGLIVAALVLLGVGLVVAYRRSERFREIVHKALALVRASAERLVAFFREHWPMIQEKFRAVAVKIEEQARRLLDWFTTHWPEISATVEAVFGYIKTLFEFYWPIISEVVKAAWETIKVIIDRAFKVIGPLIRLVMAVIRGDWSTAWEALKELLKNALTGAWEIAKTILQNIYETIKTVAGQWKDAGLEAAQRLLDAIKDKVKELPGIIKDKAKEALSWLKDTAPGVAKDYAGYAGRAIVRGVLGGLGGLLGALRDKVVEMAKAALRAAADFFTGGDGSSVPGGRVPWSPLDPRQHGGPVRKGFPYVVGEAGPELFVPNQSGRILPSVPDVRTSGAHGSDLSVLVGVLTRNLAELQTSNSLLRRLVAQDAAIMLSGRRLDEAIATRIR